MAETLAHFAVPLGKAAAEATAQPDAQAAIAANRAIFDEQVRQQREILSLQREAHRDLVETMRSEQDNFVALLEKLGLTDLREHASPQYHGTGHASEGKDGFLF